MKPTMMTETELLEATKNSMRMALYWLRKGYPGQAQDILRNAMLGMEGGDIHRGNLMYLVLSDVFC